MSQILFVDLGLTFLSRSLIEYATQLALETSDGHAKLVHAG